MNSGRKVEPIENLLTLAAATQTGAPLPESVRRWLLAGIEAHLEQGIPLDSGLQLAGTTGVCTARRRWLKMRRDHHLRQALALCGASKPWSRAVELSRHLRRFETCLWPRWRLLETPPANASQLRTHLFFAFKTGLPMPATARQLYGIGHND